MRRFSSGGLLIALGAFCLASSASVAATVVKQSGNVYYKAVCGSEPAYHHARCAANIVTDKFGKVIESTQPPVSGFGPADLSDAYKITTKGKSSTIIAIVDAFGYDNAEQHLGVYRSNFGLSACTTDNGCFKKLNQRGKQKDYPAQNIGWAQESALDIDMASAMCPNCQVWLVEGDTNSYQNLSTAVNTAAKMGAHVISNSYLGGEGGTQTYEPSYDHKGVAITASSGDGGFGTGFPATSPHVVAVGGTHLVRDGSKRGWTETVWNGAGSGCSTIYDKPSWQKDKSCVRRMVSDVSAVADPNTGVAVYGPNSGGQGTWMVFGGTSVSAPLIGGIYANNGGKLNYAETVYKKPKKRLFDVTAGSNGTCNPSYYCTGVKGYDGPTGNGTPNGLDAFGD